MSKLLMNLRRVPDEERDEVCALLEEHGIAEGRVVMNLVFAVIVGGEVPALVMRVLALLGVAGTGAAAWALVKGLRGFGHAVIALAATVVFNPVLAVGLIFLTAHAIPVQQRQIANYGRSTVWRAVALPTLIATLGALGIAALVWTGHLALPIAIALAFGMATPHMLTERLER